MEELLINKGKLIEAFKKWHEEAIENPDKFTSSKDCSSEEYAKDCADYFFELLKKLDK